MVRPESKGIKSPTTMCASEEGRWPARAQAPSGPLDHTTAAVSATAPVTADVDRPPTVCSDANEPRLRKRQLPPCPLLTRGGSRAHAGGKTRRQNTRADEWAALDQAIPRPRTQRLATPHPRVCTRHVLGALTVPRAETVPSIATTTGVHTAAAELLQSVKPQQRQQARGGKLLPAPPASPVLRPTPAWPSPMP